MSPEQVRTLNQVTHDLYGNGDPEQSVLWRLTELEQAVLSFQNTAKTIRNLLIGTLGTLLTTLAPKLIEGLASLLHHV